MPRTLLALAALAGATACGTTVPQGSVATSGTDGISLGTTAPTTTADLAPTSHTHTGSGGATQVPDSQQGGAPTGPASGVGAGTGAPRPVSVGWVVLKSNSTAASGLGLSSVATPDQTPYAQAMVDWLNAHGGLGGHKVLPVYFHMDASGSQSVDSYGTTACAAFTQDHHVDLVVDPSIGGASAILVECLDKHGVPHVDTTGSLDATSADVARHKTFFPVASIADDALAGLEVSALAPTGFYGTGSTVGVVTYDEPVFHDAVQRVLKPQLKSQTGIALQDANVVYLPPYSSLSDTGPISVAVSNAVLRFKAQGVNRVIFLQNFSLATLVFMRDAQNQRYYPRYGLSSNDSPQTLVGLAPTGQLQNATGFGWRPVYDVTAAQQLQPGRGRCLGIFKAKNLAFSPGDASEAAALRHCEGALLLKAGMDASAGALGLPLVLSLETRLGGYRAATVLGITMTRQHHDGVSAYRDLAWNGGCGCFRYTSSAQPVR